MASDSPALWENLDLDTKGRKTILDLITSDKSLVSQSLADATHHEQSYSTFAMRSFEGEFMGKRCIYKPMVVFKFSASKYKTSASVAAFGYWVYLFVTEPPFSAASGEYHHHLHNHDQKACRLSSFEGKYLTFELPANMEMVGKKFMTKA
ncbi:hypothetical protein Clacol_000938 [Clathrus columnatus]|uniref:Uncharacterized protein n=1 Tax=Clathrus columnatus TaxID=1419009 RepID=A0AAV4ZZP7_9AGAM|nr:hypothetical protein Clacol_000938 [Clathrus columnatus]